VKATAPDSEEGEKITYDEMTELAMDPDFWAAIKPILQEAGLIPEDED
jgi:hypothetical protein